MMFVLLYKYSNVGYFKARFIFLTNQIPFHQNCLSETSHRLLLLLYPAL